MTDHIIKAAKAAGGTTYTNRHYPDAQAAAFGPEALRDFYAIAFRAGMERAAEIADWVPDVGHFGQCAAAIRAEAHAQNQTEGRATNG